MPAAWMRRSVGRVTGGGEPADMPVVTGLGACARRPLPTDGLYDGLLLGQDILGDCVNMNGAPRVRTPSRRSGARSCHAPGGVTARGPPVGVLRSVARRRAESRFWGVFIIAVHRTFVLGLGARHRGIVELSEGVARRVTVFACYSSSS